MSRSFLTVEVGVTQPDFCWSIYQTSILSGNTKGSRSLDRRSEVAYLVNDFFFTAAHMEMQRQLIQGGLLSSYSECSVLYVSIQFV